MKLKHLLIASLSIVLIAAASCKKEDKKKTTAERVQSKWNVDNYTLHAHTNVDTTIVAPGSTGDYFDIRSDNKVYVLSNQTKDTLTYALQDDSTMLINNFGIYANDGTYRIRNLTDKTLALYTKEADPNTGTGFIEVTLNLSK